MVGSQRTAGDDVVSAHGEGDKATLCGNRKRDELWSKRRSGLNITKAVFL